MGRIVESSKAELSLSIAEETWSTCQLLGGELIPEPIDESFGGSKTCRRQQGQEFLALFNHNEIQADPMISA